MGMLGGGINRNPYEMINYANALDKSVETIETEITATIRQLEIYAQELDPKSQEGVESFKERSKTIQQQLDEYRRLANLLRKNANDINDLIDSTRF